MAGARRIRWWLVLSLAVLIGGTIFAVAYLKLVVVATRTPRAPAAAPGPRQQEDEPPPFSERRLRHGAPRPPNLSRAELYRRALAEYRLLDRNRDRRITAEEFKAGLDDAIAFARAHATERVPWSRTYHPDCESELRRTVARRMDRDGDGVVAFPGEYLAFSAESVCSFAKLDLDRDGSVDRDEFATGPALLGCHHLARREAEYATSFHRCLELRFSRRDANADGKLSWEELTRPGFSMLSEAEFDRLDADHDGTITRREFLSTRSRAAFALLDRNRDGELCLGELAVAEENTVREFLQHDKDRDGFLSSAELRGRARSTGPSDSVDRADFQRRDSDGDGKVSWAEYRSYPRLGFAFQAIDTSADNVLSPDEWAAASRDVLSEGGMLYNGFGPGRGSTIQSSVPGLFFMISFADLDLDGDRRVTWKEFQALRAEFRSDPRCPRVNRPRTPLRLSATDAEVLRRSHELVVAAMRHDDDVSPSRRSIAEGRLVELGPAVVPAMLTLIESGSPAAASAAAVLSRLGPRAGAAAPRLQRLLAREETRLLAAEVLAKIGAAVPEQNRRIAPSLSRGAPSGAP